MVCKAQKVGRWRRRGGGIYTGDIREAAAQATVDRPGRLVTARQYRRGWKSLEAAMNVDGSEVLPANGSVAEPTAVGLAMRALTRRSDAREVRCALLGRRRRSLKNHKVLKVFELYAS